MTDVQESSNERIRETPQTATEKVEIVSGLLLVLDQFMIGNPDFLRALPKDFQPDSEDFISDLYDQAEQFGGLAVKVSPGVYTVYRNTYDKTIALFPEFDAEKVDDKKIDDIAEEGEDVGSVLVDTRCLVFFDAALCYRDRLIEQFRKLRREEDDKGARDMIRENGASVRYGFSRRSEEIDAYFDAQSDILVLKGGD